MKHWEMLRWTVTFIEDHKKVWEEEKIRKNEERSRQEREESISKTKTRSLKKIKNNQKYCLAFHPSPR